MNKKGFLKAIMGLPKAETNNHINDMIGINADDFMSAVDRLSKVPDYNEILKENQELELELSGYRQAILNNKEYTYNIDKYTIGVDENGKDEIGLTIAIIKNGEINFLGNYYGENARCIDLLIKENQKLKKQVENYKKLGFKYLQDKNNNLETQQKEFIKWLEDYINLFDKKDIYEEGSCDTIEEILQKYKSIIGGNDV